VVGFSPCVAGVIDTTGRGGGAGVDVAAGPEPPRPACPDPFVVATANPPPRTKTTITPSAAGNLRRLRSGAIGAVTLHPIG
jgi:hypothetical protein